MHTFRYIGFIRFEHFPTSSLEAKTAKKALQNTKNSYHKLTIILRPCEKFNAWYTIYHTWQGPQVNRKHIQSRFISKYYFLEQNGFQAHVKQGKMKWNEMVIFLMSNARQRLVYLNSKRDHIKGHCKLFVTWIHIPLGQTTTRTSIAVSSMGHIHAHEHESCSDVQIIIESEILEWYTQV